MPAWSAHDDAILLDADLFARFDTVHAARHETGLSDEQVRLVERHHRDFVRAGAALPVEHQARLRELNDEISKATTGFGSTLLAEANASAVHVTEAARARGAQRRRRPGGRPGRQGARPRRLPAHPGVAHRPARAGRPAPTVTCAAGSTRRPSPAGCGAASTTRAQLLTRIARAACRAGRPLRVPRPRLLRRRGPDRRHHRGGRRDARRDGRSPRWPTPREERAAIEARHARRRCSTARCSRGTGPTTPPGSRRRRYDVDAGRRCGRTSSSTACCATASSSRPTALRADVRRAGATCPPTPRRAHLRGARRRRRRQPRARPLRVRLVRPADQARRRLDGRRSSPVAPARRAARSWPSASTSRDPPRASPR